jgi:thioredoxin-dependent peroxiredoxin
VRGPLRDNTAGGAVVLGASPDPVARVKRFHDKQGLNFRLLADEDRSVAET